MFQKHANIIYVPIKTWLLILSKRIYRFYIILPIINFLIIISIIQVLFFTNAIIYFSADDGWPIISSFSTDILKKIKFINIIILKR